MAITAEEREDRLEERAKALGQVPNYCPLGCQKEDLDEYGTWRDDPAFRPV